MSSTFAGKKAAKTIKRKTLAVRRIMKNVACMFFAEKNKFFELP
jgi:hypothetical protein